MDVTFMERAIELSRRALEEPGTEPFGAVVVKDGAVVGEGLNHARARFDPTSHGEIEAIRDACRKLRCTDLSGCDLYTSCEPCALCVAAMRLVGIRRLFYAASLDQSDRALGAVSPEARPKTDTADLRREAGLPVEERRMPSARVMDTDAVAVLDAWAAKHRDRPWKGRGVTPARRCPGGAGDTGRNSCRGRELLAGPGLPHRAGAGLTLSGTKQQQRPAAGCSN